MSASGYPASIMSCVSRGRSSGSIDWPRGVYGIPWIGMVVLIVKDVIEGEADMLRADELRNVVYVTQQRLGRQITLLTDIRPKADDADHAA